MAVTTYSTSHAPQSTSVNGTHRQHSPKGPCRRTLWLWPQVSCPYPAIRSHTSKGRPGKSRCEPIGSHLVHQPGHAVHMLDLRVACSSANPVRPEPKLQHPGIWPVRLEHPFEHWLASTPDVRLASKARVSLAADLGKSPWPSWPATGAPPLDFSEVRNRAVRRWTRSGPAT